MKSPKAADVEAMSKAGGGATPNKAHIESLLTRLGTGEDLRWCATYPDLEKKWGPMAFLAVTDRRVIWQRYAAVTKSKPDVIELPLDDITTARDEAKPMMFGLMTNHVLAIIGPHTTIRIPNLRDKAVALGAQAIVSAKIDRLSEAGP